MAQYLCYQWIHPDHDAWTCADRKFDGLNENAKVKLQIPWIRWPEDESEEGKEHTIHWKDIYNRAVEAVDQWAYVLRQKVSGENFPWHEILSCMIQMHEQLLHTIFTLREKDRHLRLFYGFAADRVAMLEEIQQLALKQVVFVVGGRARIREYGGYEVLLK
ncbi:hypothetical protein NW757_005995 [Fusarium falciforme]|nr:hypothetical protein NW757_005995 [Fusarium falciforme]